MKLSIKFGAGADYNGKHFKLLSSSEKILSHYNILIFTDSRGTATENDNIYSWVNLLLDELKKNNLSYLCISRPKEMTIYFSLINFLNNNSISYDFLITNLGFVDFTPKKIEFIRDITTQIPNEFSKLQGTYIPLGEYLLNSGDTDMLYSFDYGKIEHNISHFLSNKFKYCILLGCLEFSKNIQIERERPESFYSQIKRTNEFIFNIAQESSNIHFVQPLKYPIQINKLSFDGVHLTEFGHKKTFDLIYPFIKFYILNSE